MLPRRIATVALRPGATLWVLIPGYYSVGTPLVLHCGGARSPAQAGDGGRAQRTPQQNMQLEGAMQNHNWESRPGGGPRWLITTGV